MRTIKQILIIISLVLLSSCASFQLGTTQVRTVNFPTSQYMFNNYNYNSLHFLYINNPSYFYENFYYDGYGVRQYYYTHPFFIRYYTYRNITPNHNYYIRLRNNRVSTARRVTTPTRRVTTPTKRTNITRRSTIRPKNNSTVRRQNMVSRKRAAKAKIRIPRRNK